MVASGRWVADSPIRCGGAAPGEPATNSSSRSRLSARCEPRFEDATEWTSSTITQRTEDSTERACEVSIR